MQAIFTLDAIEWLAQQNVGLYTLDLVGELCLNLIPAISPHRPFQRKAQYTADTFFIVRSIVREKLNEAARVKPELTLLYRRILNDISRIGSVDMLRLAEGRAAILYWTQWNFGSSGKCVRVSQKGMLKESESKVEIIFDFQ